MVNEDLGPGEKLRTVRETNGLALADVSEITKITVTALKGIEDEDFSVLPGGVYTRSFIKNYCVALGLEPELIVSEFSERYPDEVGQQIRFDDVNVVSADEHQSEQLMARTAVVVAGLSIPVLIFGAYLDFADHPETTEEVIAVDEGEAEMPEPKSPSETIQLEPEVDTRPIVNPEQELVIELTPEGDCWVSAVVDGVESMSKLMRPGERETIRFTERAILNVGDAGVLSLKINNRTTKSLGGDGEVVTATIDRSNYQSYFLEE